MATIRKIRLRWQAIVRRKRIHVSKSFWKKGDARRWADKIEAQIEVGFYLGTNIVLPFGPTIKFCFAHELIDKLFIILSLIGLGGAQPKPFP